MKDRKIESSLSFSIWGIIWDNSVGYMVANWENANRIQGLNRMLIPTMYDNIEESDDEKSQSRIV